MRYYSLNRYCRDTFGEKLYKLSLDGGMTCPNRDGTLSSLGCLYCSAGGSGDFAADRIVPDCVRAAEKKEPIIVRNPHSTRPFQHVLEPLFLYLTVAKAQWENAELAGCYNVGPDDCDCVNTGRLADLFCETWGGGMHWINRYDGGPHEANFLKLDCSKVKKVFGWKPHGRKRGCASADSRSGGRVL